MGNVTMKSSELPKIGIATKKMVNLGVWYLYKINNNAATYLLIADGSSYLLEKDGTVKSKEDKRPSNLELIDSVYFSDLQSPESLSNLQHA